MRVRCSRSAGALHTFGKCGPHTVGIVLVGTGARLSGTFGAEDTVASSLTGAVTGIADGGQISALTIDVGTVATGGTTCRLVRTHLNRLSFDPAFLIHSRSAFKRKASHFSGPR